MKYVYYLIAFVTGAIVAAIIVISSKQGFSLILENNTLIIIGIFLLAFLCIASVFSIARKSMDRGKPLGLPNGSVRAIIALLVIIFFVLTAMLCVFSSINTEISKQILTTMATLAIAVSSFYFGSKATEEGSKISQEVFTQALTATSQTELIPIAIIQEAIKNNKEQWLIIYECLDIHAGQKSTQNVTNNINCIVFVVKEKSDKQTPIPPTIPYNTANKTYAIPTDVQEENIAANDGKKPSINSIDVEGQYKIVQQYIDNNDLELKENHPQITGIKAEDFNKTLPVTIGIVLEVESLMPDLPPIVVYEGYVIPVYQKTGGYAKPHSSPQYLDAGISRRNDTEFGTCGIPVHYQNQLHILSCFHVFFNEEMKRGSKKVDSTTSISDRKLISPCFSDRVDDFDDVVGEVIEGEISEFMDIAIMKPNVEFEKTFKRLKGPNSYTVLSRAQQEKIFLQFWGNGSKQIRTGKLININSGQWVEYDGLERCYIRGLIQIERCAVGGDSGAAVTDSDNRLIGIVLGSDPDYTYIISAYNIQDKSKYTLLT